MAHGRSFSTTYPIGARAMTLGLAKAPRSMRKRGKHFLKECTEEELERAGVGREGREPEALLAANML